MVSNKRKKTKEIRIGNCIIGGNHPIVIQSMCNTKTEQVEETVAQIQTLEQAGCQIIRCAVPTLEAAKAIEKIKKQITIPLIADIHFDYRLALAAMEYGADKIRINPGNIGSAERVEAIVQKAKQNRIPIRIGVNGGSLEKSILQKYGSPSAEAMVESILQNIKQIEQFSYDQLILSIKSSNVLACVHAYEQLAKQTDYPLHIGITEAGSLSSGTIKSAVGLGILLYEGLGDTMRVSLTADPLEEIKVAKQILKTVGLRKDGVEVIACPTCGRTQIALFPLVEQVEKMVQDISIPMTVAVMGCAVNGPGEAREADLGIAGGKEEGALFRKGKLLYKVKQEKLLEAFQMELERFQQEYQGK